MGSDIKGNEIKVVIAGQKSSALVRDILFVSVIVFFVVISYMAHLENVVMVFSWFIIGSFLVTVTMYKMFTGENLLKIMYFHLTRDRKWK